MKKLFAIVLAVVMLASFSGFAMAENFQETGNGALSGPHYNLEIIGVPKDKNPNMNGNGGNVIFVNLKGHTNINLCESGLEGGCLPDGDFAVLDKNGTDGEALFALPAPDDDNTGTSSYTVFARALGKPGGKSYTTTCRTDGDEVYCSSITMKLERTKGQQKFQNVTKYLLYLYIDGVREPLFGDKNENYWWYYDNMGLKHAQLRFYMTPTENIPANMPCLVSVSPDNGNADSTANYIITGSDGTGSCLAVDFTDNGGVNPNRVDFGLGTTVNSVTVDSTTQLTVNVSIDADAPTGPRKIYVKTQGEWLNLDFEVN